MKIVANNFATANKPLTEDEIQRRVLEVVKNYDKIVADKVFFHFQLFTNRFCFFFSCFSLSFVHFGVLFAISLLYLTLTVCVYLCKIVNGIQKIRCWQPNPKASISNVITTRHYSDKQPLSLKLIQERVLLVLNLYDKIDPAKVD